MKIALATRSADKMREIRAILRPYPDLNLVSLAELDLPPHPAEEDIEQFDTFEENALAKARFFAQHTGITTLADDSGLCVDALQGAPGVRSKRFSGDTGLQGRALDEANNDQLLTALRDVPAAQRTAHYVCVAALVSPAGNEHSFRGTCHGLILRERCGTGGFGYDSLFHLPPENATFAQLSARRKNAISHRASAMRAMARSLCGEVDSGSQKL